jgi:hypothetical protein
VCAPARARRRERPRVQRHHLRTAQHLGLPLHGTQSAGAYAHEGRYTVQRDRLALRLAASPIEEAIDIAPEDAAASAAASCASVARNAHRALERRRRRRRRLLPRHTRRLLPCAAPSVGSGSSSRCRACAAVPAAAATAALSAVPRAHAPAQPSCERIGHAATTLRLLLASAALLLLRGSVWLWALGCCALPLASPAPRATRSPTGGTSSSRHAPRADRSTSSAAASTAAPAQPIPLPQPPAPLPLRPIPPGVCEHARPL